jgi:hypothetical protein
MYKILPELVINWDQTGINIVPLSQWTMDVEGAKCSKCPPFSNNKLLSCESTIPFAAVLTIAEFTTLPESRTDLIKKTENISI